MPRPDLSRWWLAGLPLAVNALACAPAPSPPAPRCAPLHAHCDASAHQGCDTDLSKDPAHCGACGVACAEGASCHAGSCTAGIRGVAIGGSHACAVAATGEVRCWGEGSAFQLGDAALAPSYVPVRVTGLDDAVALAASGDGTCALRRSGAVACWGTHPAWPQPQPIPQTVAGLPPATALSLSPLHACAVTRQGELWCWGSDIGPGDAHASFTPIASPGLAGVVAVATGDTTDCVVARQGQVLCWETALYGHPATVVAGITGAVEVGVGLETGCAADAHGDLSCWKHYRGAAADHYRASPGPVSSVRSLAMTGDHACAALADGSARCWGKNDWGQLGRGVAVDGGAPDPHAAAPVAGLTDARRVAVSGATSCAVRADGSLACWGEGRHGQIGPAARAVFREPTRVQGLPPVTGVAVAWRETCAVSADHTLRCWGGAELRDHPEAARPRLEPAPPIEALVMSNSETCAVTTAGTVVCRVWPGGRKEGPVWRALPGLTDVAGFAVVDAGDGTGYARLRSGEVLALSLRGGKKPLPVEGLRGVTALAGGARPCAITDHGARCWSNDEVQQALAAAGARTLRPHSIAAAALAGAPFLGDGCAVTSSGRIRCWGPLLRRGTLASYDLGAEGAVRFAASSRNLCAILAAGHVACREGDDLVPVSGITGAVDVAVDDDHACAVLAGGELRCWGDNDYGAVGQTLAPSSAVPVVVPWDAVGPPRAPAPAPTGPRFVRRRGTGGLEGVDACVYLGFAGPDCLNALLAEPYPVRRRYMRRLTDAAARLAQEGLARGEDPGGVPHAEMAMFCARSGPCGQKNREGVPMDDGYACLTAAESAPNHADAPGIEPAHARACRCDPVRAQIPIMGGVLACDGPDKPVERGLSLSLTEAREIRACAECDPASGATACAHEIARLRTADPEMARYVETDRVPRCLEE